MATITSPRLSSPAPSISSQRTSLDTQNSSFTSHPRASGASAAAAAAGGSVGSASGRRNRAALRDYYGIRGSGGAATQSEPGSGASTPTAAAGGASTGTGTGTASGATSQQESDQDQASEGGGVLEGSELDSPSFDAQKYVSELLARESLSGVLRVEAALVNEIKFLDGERKALVYDNYSKLIAATETIRRMRANMDPLAPTTSTLAPAVSHIADTAKSLAAQVVVAAPQQAGGAGAEMDDADEEDEEGDGNGSMARKRESNARATVKWVLDAPQRFAEKGRETEQVEAEWEVVRGLLERWKKVEGAEKVRQECEKALQKSRA